MTVAPLEPALDPAAPLATATTARVYGRCPAYLRDADPGEGFALLRYTALVGDLAGEGETLLDRIAAGELTDPDRADAAWLPWLAMLLGAPLPGGLDEATRRAAIANGAVGRGAGTMDTIAAAARTALSGAGTVTVLRHWQGDAHALAISTTEEETADPAAVLAAIRAAGAVPAGHTIVHTFYAPSWGTLEARVGTWELWEARGTWARIGSTLP